MKQILTTKHIVALSLVLVFAFGLALTGVLLSAPKAMALPSLSNVYVDGDGVLRWDAFAGAAEYSVTCGSSGGYARDAEGNAVTFYDLEYNAKQFHWESGTYNWSVYACDENGDAISATAEGTYTFTNTQTPLDTPTNPVWDHVMCRWDEVEGAVSYHICVYNAANNSLLAYDTVYGTSTNEWHFASAKVDVEYYFEVMAQAGFDDLDHKHSAFARSANKTFPQVVAALSGVTITEGMLTWDAVAGETHWDVGVGSGGGDYYEKPVDLYLMCAQIGLETGTYQLRIQVYNEYDEPLAPLYTDDNFEWDTSYGPQPISGTVSIVGDAKVGVTLSADVSNLTYEGDLTYTWWVENGLGAWVPYGEMDRTENTFYINDELLGRRFRVRVESSDNTGWVESDPTDVIAERTHTVEITSAGGNPVKAELEESDMVEGTLPVGHMGEPYSATLVATGASSYTWSLVLGDLAEGLTLSPSGVISGTPTGTSTGFITVKAADSADSSNFDIVRLTFNVAGADWAPTITTESLDNGVENGEYNFTIECFFVGPAPNIDWDVVAGALPSGLTLGMDGFYNARLYGLPTLPGTYTFSLRASNDYGEDVKEFTLVVESVFAVDYPEGRYYQGDTVQLQASIGNDKVNWSINVANSANTTISQEGILTIGEDEDASYITVVARSKTSNNNYTQILVYYRRCLPYTVTVSDAVVTDSSDNPISKAGEGEDVYIEAIDKEGYRFRCWTVEEGSAEVTLGDENYYDTSFTMPAGNVILKANYDQVISAVSATFDRPINGNHVDQTLTTGGANYTATMHGLSSGYSLSLDDTVYETGRDYWFYVRFEAAAGCVLADRDELSVTINGVSIPCSNEDEDKGYNFSQGAWYIKLTAISDEIPLYAVTVEHGHAGATTAEEGETITITAAEPEEGYVFDRWTSEDGVTFADATSAETSFVMPANAVTVTATYKEIARYTVSFEAGEGTGSMSAQQFNEGASFVLPASLFVAPPNKEFKCWSVGGQEKQVGDTIVVNSDLTVSAVWQAIQREVSFAAGEGSGSMAAASVDQGATYTLPACTLTAPLGKIFKCWKAASGQEYQVGAAIVINSDITLTAIWEEAQRTISFDAGDGSGEAAPIQLNIGDVYPLPAAPFEAPEGKEFAGWSRTPNGPKIAGDSIVVDGDIQLYALWKDIEPQQGGEQPGEPGAQPADKGGLSGGAIAGIVIAVVLVCGLGGFAIFWFVIKKKTFADLIAVFKKK